MTGVRPRYMCPNRHVRRAMRLLLLARHGQSLFNVDGVVNGDPALDRGLSRSGMEEARELAAQIAGVRDRRLRHLRVPARAGRLPGSRSGRARTTSRRRAVDPELNDIRIGDARGTDARRLPRLEARARAATEPFPGGESLDDAARRYAAAYERLLHTRRDASSASATRSPCATRSTPRPARDDLDAPLHDVANATPYLFDDAGPAREPSRASRS